MFRALVIPLIIVVKFSLVAFGNKGTKGDASMPNFCVTPRLKRQHQPDNYALYLSQMTMPIDYIGMAEEFVHMGR